MPLPEWFDSEVYDRQRQNARSAAQEARRAAETGGRVQPGSGSSWRAPGDVKTDRSLEQCKYTDKPRFTLDVVELQKSLVDAELMGRDANWIINFETQSIRCVVTIERTP